MTKLYSFKTLPIILITLITIVTFASGLNLKPNKLCESEFDQNSQLLRMFSHGMSEDAVSALV
jgi:hypothetical protein